MRHQNVKSEIVKDFTMLLQFALYISLYALILRSSGMVGVLYKKRQGGFQFGIWNVSVFLGGISSDFVCRYLKVITDMV